MPTMALVSETLGNLWNYFKEVNTATLNGSIDIVAVEYPDGRIVSTPFHVRFGKVGVVRASDKIVSITVNGEMIEKVTMKLGNKGEAFFVVPVDDISPRTNRPGQESIIPGDEDIQDWMTSPIPSPPYSDDENQESYPQYTTESQTLPPSAFKQRARSSEHHPSSKMQSAQDAADSSDDENVEASTSRRSSEFRRRAKSLTETSINASSLQLPEGNDSEIEWKYGHPVPKQVKSQVSTVDSVSTVKDIRLQNSKSESSTVAPAIPQLETYLSDSGMSNTNSMFDLSGTTPPANTTITADNVPGTPPRQPTIENPEPLLLTQLQNADPTVRNAYGLAAKPTEPDDADIFELSLYGQHMTPGKQIDGTLWEDCRVTYDQFKENPFDFIANKDLRVKYNNKYLTWSEAAPFMVSLCVFRRKLVGNFEESQRLRHLSTSFIGKQSSEEPPAARTKSFFSLFVRSPAATTEPSASSSTLTTPLKVDPKDAPEKEESSREPGSTLDGQSARLVAEAEQLSFEIGADPEAVSLAQSCDPLVANESTETLLQPSGVCRKLPYSTHRRSTIEVLPTQRSNLAETLFNENDSVDGEVALLARRSMSADQHDKLLDDEVESLTEMRYKKSLNLTSDQLKLMKLQYGRNEVVFSVTTQYQGTTKCHAAIYLFKYTDRLVISDIDGTITKSDVIGMVVPAVGGGSGWTHPGVASLYRNIQSNGYKFVYLSSRAIGQANMTKSYLDQVEQQGLRLPHGPVLLSPNSLFNAFKREVVYRNPEEFKIECLEHVKNLFPENYNPFYAGFGNKVNDCMAYNTVGIQKHRIYIINPKGEVRPQDEALAGTFTTSYETLVDVVDYHFPVLRERSRSVVTPPIQGTRTRASTVLTRSSDDMEQSGTTAYEDGQDMPSESTRESTIPISQSHTEFNASSFWRNDLPDISADLDSFK